MSNDELEATLKAEAEPHGVKVVFGPFGSIELEAPQGKQWSEELHVLVTSPWDNDTTRSVLRGALRDLRNNIRYLQPCPENCPCTEVD